MTSPARPPRRMTPEARRAQLVSAALDLYGARSPEEVAVEDVTRAADVSRALFYRYFSGMEELHVAALGSVAEELIDRVALPTDGPLDGQLADALDVFLDVVGRHSRAYIALLRSGSVVSTGETDAMVDGVRDHIVDLLCVRGGVPDPTPLQLMTLRGWVALVEGSVLVWLEAGRVPAHAELRDWLVEQLFAMLGVTVARDPDAQFSTTPSALGTSR
ncbi:TetR/AcrR family transcriptional regulator [Pseudonocardia alni]|uniref:AcrR family transcriptional regulator n=3 Tax=Pseudonocardia TaxID=1847 RepID=A0A852WE07_PSEA5|nr:MULTISPECIES: TetR/AcrR family transcriptional regulator [Pseudonocardia]MCO7195305.1 TetR/AcrR family transcriptional regulator [Pseudonocardia sp. McavD-2-B]NYG04515.1 AcrR family transcriptional regulator [Pseudonocardia antarctica]